ncbi:MAG: hypothetical protein GEV11_08395 [Streptosporangiales bacterium]|nr:hypothetical protein [Streptosporangiales bacterium]
MTPAERLPADDPATFVVTVSNSGNEAAGGGKLDINPFGLVINGAPPQECPTATATDPDGNGHILKDCDVGTLAPGASKSFTLNGTSSAGVRTQAFQVTQSGDTDTTNNSLSRKITFYDSVDLGVSIDHQDGNGGRLRAGDPVRIEVRATNLGPDTASEVTADVDIPSWRSASRDSRCTSAYVCPLGSMSDDESTELVFRGSFDPDAGWPERAQITAKVRDGSTLTDDSASPNDSATLTLAVDSAPRPPDDGDGDNDSGSPGEGDDSSAPGKGSSGGASNPSALPPFDGPAVAAPPGLTGVGLGLPTVGNGVDLPMVGPNPATPAGKGATRADGENRTAKIVPPTILIALLMLLAWVALPALPSRRVRIRRR